MWEQWGRGGVGGVAFEAIVIAPLSAKPWVRPRPPGGASKRELVHLEAGRRQRRGGRKALPSERACRGSSHLSFLNQKHGTHCRRYVPLVHNICCRSAATSKFQPWHWVPSAGPYSCTDYVSGAVMMLKTFFFLTYFLSFFLQHVLVQEKKQCPLATLGSRQGQVNAFSSLRFRVSARAWNIHARRKADTSQKKQKH